jgi:hypothetical protein
MNKLEKGEIAEILREFSNELDRAISIGHTREAYEKAVQAILAVVENAISIDVPSYVVSKAQRLNELNAKYRSALEEIASKVVADLTERCPCLLCEIRKIVDKALEGKP